MQQTQLHNRGGQSEDSSLSSFSKEEVLRIQSQLRQVLGPEHISTRQGSGNVRLSYIEGWRIISIANQIFGFDGWRSSIQSFSIDYVDQLEGGRLNVGASCMMRITLRDGTYKEDIGFGMIENAKSKGMAFEKVKKEAVTDAIKRAMRQFGNVLGNCVYDKEFVKSISQFPKQPRGRVQSEDLYRYSDLVIAYCPSRVLGRNSLLDRRSEGTVDFDMYDLDDDAFDGIGMMETDRPIIPESPTPRAYDHQPAPPTNVYNQQTTPARVDPASGPRWRPASAPVSHSNAAGNGPSPSPGGPHIANPQAKHFAVYNMASKTLKQVARVITAHRQREGGGFMVRRPLPSGGLESADPFLMLDHLGPVYYGPGEAVGAPDHPHRGFETVTYMLDGEFEHHDSHGNHGILKPGWVQWMTAGSGVIHSEMPSDKLLKEGGNFHGFQIWVNLPAKDKMIRPRYQDVPPEDIPWFESADGQTKVKVIAGEVENVKANIDTHTPVYFLDLRTTGKYSLRIPEGMDAMAYNYHTAAILVGQEKTKLAESQLAILKTHGEPVTFEAAEDAEGSEGKKEARVLILAGTPIGEKVAKYGPFVMNTDEELYQALADVEAGRFGTIPGSSERRRKTDEANERRLQAGKH
ncbi:hypothetical protein GGI04_004373 [Coemansia thaxteri]|nr:hypothetical protein GGI04_004373 [Coemansia thaxteri]